MTKTYCDRCKKEIGVGLYSGIKLIDYLKKHWIKFKSSDGWDFEIDICTKCFTDFENVLREYTNGKLR